jgi:hypothetical protein
MGSMLSWLGRHDLLPFASCGSVRAAFSCRLADMGTKVGAAREQPDAAAIPDRARCKLMIGFRSKTGGNILVTVPQNGAWERGAQWEIMPCSLKDRRTQHAACAALQQS